MGGSHLGWALFLSRTPGQTRSQMSSYKVVWVSFLVPLDFLAVRHLVPVSHLWNLGSIAFNRQAGLWYVLVGSTFFFPSPVVGKKTYLLAS